MRLWHYKLIPHLPRQQLLGQHRECCALRGKGWGRKHSTVDYVFKYSYFRLVDYHRLIMLELIKRGYGLDSKWFDSFYRGKQIGLIDLEDAPNYVCYIIDTGNYPEHNDKYLQECLENLKCKGIIIDLTNKTNNIIISP